MAGKVTAASEQIRAWLERYRTERIESHEKDELTLGAALDAIKDELSKNPVVEGLSRDALRVRAARLQVRFREKGTRQISESNQQLNDWLRANCANHSLQSAVAAIQVELHQGVKPNVLEMRKRSLGLTFGKSGVVTRSATDWVAKAIMRAFAAKRPPASLASLMKRVMAETPAGRKTKAEEMSEARLLEELDALYWKASGRAELFTNAIKAGYGAKRLHELFKGHWHDEAPLPPVWAVEEKMHSLHGRVSAPHTATRTHRGILRAPIKGAKAVTFPAPSYLRLTHGAPEVTQARVKLGVIAAPQVGLPYEESDIVDNLLRLGFSASRKMSCDALVIGGGLFRLAWQKTAGPKRLLADLVSAIKIDPDSLETPYNKEAQRIIEDGSFEPIFMTAEEQLNELLRAWYKVTRRPGNRPEFEGPVYVVLHDDDFGLVCSMAYYELRYQQYGKMLQAQAKERLLQKFAAAAFLNGSKGDCEKAQTEADAASREASRYRATYLAPMQNKLFVSRACGYLVERIEGSIPNAKVIGLNAAYLRFGASDKVIKFTSSGKNPHYAELGNYGPAVRNHRLPALTVAMHQRATWMRETVREDYREGSMLKNWGGAFVEAPMLIDAKPILEEAGGAHIPLPVMKAVRDPMFAPGMLVVTIDPVLGVNPDVVPAGAVRKLGAPQTGAVRPPAKRMWLVVSTDMHFGAANRLFVRRPSGMRMGLTEAGFELMQRDGLAESGAAPVVGFIAADDLTQGNHFDTHVRPHHNRRTNVAVLDELDARLEAITKLKGPVARERELRTMLVDTADQIVVRTPDHLGSQFDEMRQGFLIPYRSIFTGVLIAAKEAGVSVKGVSHFTGARFDSRDVGLINFGSGNHATKTTNGMIYEGNEVAAFLRESLRVERGLAGIDLASMVRAPLFQDRSIGYGRIRAHGGRGYEWGLHITGTPPKRDSWLDVLHGWIEANRHVGNPSGILDGVATLHVTGDKHFFASAFAGGDLYVMGSSSTHTDAFAYIAGGLPENNAGLVFIGLPVEGPDAAEISVVHMQPKLIQDFILSGKKFPWEEFLPHRA